jgi:hypothetical protein
MILGAHLFGLPNVSQAVFELTSHGSRSPLVFLSVMWSGSFLQARGSGRQSFDSPWFFISAKCGPSISARVLIHRAHAVCFCTLVATLNLPLCILCVGSISTLFKFLVSLPSCVSSHISVTSVS